jgi:cyclopropane fatty-acyl-phospholipid synthase-like methyltransferase
MNTSRNPWDDDYLHRGRLWGGSTPSLPELPGSRRILELGCGDGKTVSTLVQAGCSVTALDISPHAATLCRKTCPDSDRVSLLIADTRQIPFRDESFDGIIASHIAGHLGLAGRRQLACEVRRLLIPGGMMYFRDFSILDFRFGRGEETEAGTFLRKNGIATHYFTDDEVQSFFSRFEVHSLVEHQWEMRVRGRTFIRAEIVAEGKKPA